MDTPGFDRCELTDTATGHRLAGTALVAMDGTPHEIRYTVLTDPEWRTTTVGAHVQGPGADRRLALGADGLGNWTVSESPVIDLYGAIDVDLAWTPATNTLPVRRLALEIGESAEITVAYIRYPSHEIGRATQRYERLTDDVFRYESGTFSAEVTFAASGLVSAYEGIWESVASA